MCEPSPRLRLFAVVAFCAEMTRLASHWSVYWEPENATAQTVPSFATSVPHMLKPRPPLPAALTAPSSADCRAAWLGRPEQVELPSARAEPDADKAPRPIAPKIAQCWIFMSLPLCALRGAEARPS